MRKLIFLMSLCLLFVASTSLAEDIQPPSWRGQWSTTSQIWEFSTNVGPGIPIYPDGPAPGGQPPLPSTQLVWEPGPPPWDEWMAQDEPFAGGWIGYGVYPLSGWIDVIVDNHEPPNEVKYVWVQITWRPQSPDEYPIFGNLDPDPVYWPELVQEVPLGDEGHWCHYRESTYQWEIRPNPPWEKFTIGGTINVDELVIDTWCIPEPTTLLLLGLGGLLLRRRKR